MEFVRCITCTKTEKKKKEVQSMTNTKLLEQLIEESGLKKKYLAEKIGLTPAGFRNCITNKAEFRASHIAILCEELGIVEPEQKEAIFFAVNGA